MARKVKEMSALEVSRLKKPGMHFVGGVPGLALRIVPPPSVSKSWVLRVSIAGDRTDKGLGGFPEVTLAQAKEVARAARAKLREGRDPFQEAIEARLALASTRATTLLFKDAAEKCIKAKESGWKNAKHRRQWESTLEKYAFPIIGNLSVREITKHHILQILEPIWTTHTETASRVRGRIETILDWAKASEYRTGDNPAAWKGNLDALLAAPKKVNKVEHHAALPYAKQGKFMAELKKLSGTGSRALEFAILTAARSGEVRGATWQEIDEKAAYWTIPAARMKAEKEHRIPLSPAALDLLKALPKGEGADLVFPSTRGTPLSDMTLTATLRRMGYEETVHGFRSTFRDWAGETTNYPREVVEHALAHQLPDKAEAAYARGTLLEKRRNLMNDWAKFCNTIPTDGDNVVPIGEAMKSKTAA